MMQHLSQKTPLTPHLMMNDHLITEILSWLPVESLIRFKCVCRFWSSLISNPSFLKLHFHRSSLHHDLLLTSKTFLMPCSKRDLLITNQHSTLTIVAPPTPTPSPTHQGLIKLNPKYRVTGSCNGLLCLYAYASSHYWIRFWNPAMKLRSKKSPTFSVKDGPPVVPIFGFGLDESSDTYKVVALLASLLGSSLSLRGSKIQTKVYSMGGDRWRDIQDFPGLFPVGILPCVGSFLSGTLNWIAFRISTVEQLFIVSLDLGKETFGTLLLPSEVVLDVLPIKRLMPSLGVLRDCLCVSNVDKKAATPRFVVWKMNKFGDEKSWTQIVNVCYQPLQIQIDMYVFTSHWAMFPLCVSENGDVLMLKDLAQQGTQLYISIHTDISIRERESAKFMYFMDYAQSLVLPYRHNSFGGTQTLKVSKKPKLS